MNQNQVQEHFAKQADDYESLMVRLVPYYREQSKIISDLLPTKDRAYRVLDLGCGNGILSEMVFRKLPNSYVVGLDLTLGMLNAFEKKLSGYAGKFELRQADYRSDDIGKEYDIVIAGLTLHHLTWEERENFYRTIYSALNQSGLFISQDIIIDEDPMVAENQYAHWKAFMKSQGEDPEFWYSKHREKDHPVTLSDHFAWLKQAGFSKVTCQWRYCNFMITKAEKIQVGSNGKT